MHSSGLRIGIVGCGRVVERFHLPALQRSSIWRLEGAADPSPERRAILEKHLPGQRVFGSAEALLDTASLEAVLIAAPPSEQVGLARQALDRGLSVLIEKPGGLGARQLESLANLRSNSRVVWVGFNRRFHRSYGRFKEGLEKLLGQDLQLKLHMRVSRSDWDSISAAGDRRGWSVYEDVASHQLDAVQWLTGEELAKVKTRNHTLRPGLEALTYMIELAGGMRIKCFAEHAPGYHEQLVVTASDRAHIAYPTGYLELPLGLSVSQGAASFMSWLDRKWIRLGLQADPLGESFRQQLEMFARSVAGGEPAIRGAHLRQAIKIHRALTGLRRSAEAGGDWVELGSASVLPQ